MRPLSESLFPEPIESLVRSLRAIGFFDRSVLIEGLKKSTRGGCEVEFFVHRHGGKVKETRTIAEWGITALPLPFIKMLVDFTESMTLAPDAMLRNLLPKSHGRWSARRGIA